MNGARESAAAAMVRIARARFRIVRDERTEQLFAVSDDGLPPISFDGLPALLARAYHDESGKVASQEAKKRAVEILADPEAPTEDVTGPTPEDLSREEETRQQLLAEFAKQSAHLREVPDLLALLDEEIHKDGFAGETTVPRLVFLSVYSSLLDIRRDGFADRLVSNKIDGATSAGKNYAVDVAVAYLPDEAVIRITGQSAKALVYGTDSLERKFLYFPEGVGIRDDSDAAIFLRSLLSEGEIRYHTVITQEGSVPRTETIVRKGPTGALVTTSAVRLDRDLDARLLRFTVDDSKQLTEKIISRHGERAARGSVGERDRSAWHALYSWLLLQAPIPVRVPFAEKVAKKIPPAAVRLRRDVATLFTLTAAHTALHLAHRSSDDEGFLLSTGEDYTVARDLVDSILGAGAETLAPEWALATWRACPSGPDGDISYSALGRKLGIGADAARTRALKLIESGYLVNLEQRERFAAKLIRGDLVPNVSEGFLPRFDELDDTGGGAPPEGSTGNPETPRQTATGSGNGVPVEEPEPQPETSKSGADADDLPVSGRASGPPTRNSNPHEQAEFHPGSGFLVDPGTHPPKRGLRIQKRSRVIPRLPGARAKQEAVTFLSSLADGQWHDLVGLTILGYTHSSGVAEKIPGWALAEAARELGCPSRGHMVRLRPPRESGPPDEAALLADCQAHVDGGHARWVDENPENCGLCGVRLTEHEFGQPCNNHSGGESAEQTPEP